MSGKVAPHENRELDMVLRGEKPMCSISQTKNPVHFKDAETLSRHGTLVTYFHHQTLVCVLPKDEWCLEVYKNYLESDRLSQLNYTILMGRLFGYSDDDIYKFIQVNECECVQCVGLVRWKEKRGGGHD